MSQPPTLRELANQARRLAHGSLDGLVGRFGGTMKRDDERCYWCCEPMVEAYAEGKHERHGAITLVCSQDCLGAAKPWFAERAANKIPMDAWTVLAPNVKAD